MLRQPSGSKDDQSIMRSHPGGHTEDVGHEVKRRTTLGRLLAQRIHLHAVSLHFCPVDQAQYVFTSQCNSGRNLVAHDSPLADDQQPSMIIPGINSRDERNEQTQAFRGERLLFRLSCGDFQGS